MGARGPDEARPLAVKLVQGCISRTMECLTGTDARSFLATMSIYDCPIVTTWKGAVCVVCLDTIGNVHIMGAWLKLLGLASSAPPAPTIGVCHQWWR